MKLFRLVFLSLSFAQRKSPRPIDISPSDNNAQKSYAEYPPDEQAVVYGDPHFMVTGETGERICFDFNPELGSNINLLSDPKSNLHVSGIISDETIKGKTFIHEIQFMSPEGGNLRFNPDGVFVKSFSLKETMQYDYKEPIRFMDILFTEHRNADGTREKITVEIDDGPKFLIKAKQSRGSMSFGIEDTTGLSDKTKGILGSFIHEGAFHVLNLHTKGENGEETAVVISQDLGKGTNFAQENDLKWI